MNDIRLKARAKINLTLDVLGKRTDGYHEIESIMQSVYLCDEIYIFRTSDRQICLSTNLPYVPTDDRNIAMKAAHAFFEGTGIPASGLSIHIQKYIPVAAGLAGGSADGAAVLIGLSQLYAPDMSRQELLSIGARVGSDVPFCIENGTALARGRGELLEKLPAAPFFHVVLVKPPFSVSSAKGFAELDKTEIGCRPQTAKAIRAIRMCDPAALAAYVCNVMEPPVASARKEVNDIKKTLWDHGALAASMSGSGPTVFGLFERKGPAIKAAMALSAIYSDTFLTGFFKPHD